MKGLQHGRGNANDRDALRGQHLERLGRNDDAKGAYRDALAQDPDNPRVLQLLAYCQLKSEGEASEALHAIDRAIELDPLDPMNHVVRALILVELNRLSEAQEAAEHGIRLSPEEPMAHTALAQRHLRAQDWSAAETAAKRALSFDPDEDMASTILAHALFCQGKQVENQVHVSGMLHRDPQDPYSHHAAGLAALQAQDYSKAEQHFMEALRLDPDFGGAREGLLEAFRARSVFYRKYLSYAFFMTRLTPRQRLGLIFGVLLGVQLLLRVALGPLPGLTVAVAGLYFLLVLWTYVARPVGTLVILGDATARHALRPRERVEALFAGGSAVLGGIVMGTGLLLNQLDLAAAGFGCLALSIPVVLALDAEGRRGQRFYGALAALGVGGLTCLLAHLFFPSGASLLVIGMTGSLSSVLVASWCAAFKVYRND